MSDTNPNNLEQTAFSEAAPLMDADGGQRKTTKPAAKSLAEEAPKRAVKKPNLLLLLGTGLVGILVLLSVAAILMPRVPRESSSDGPNVSETPSPASKLPLELQKAIATLADYIKDADPQANDLPFPPVNFQLHLKTPESVSQ